MTDAEGDRRDRKVIRVHLFFAAWFVLLGLAAITWGLVVSDPGGWVGLVVVAVGFLPAQQAGNIAYRRSRR